VIFPAWDHGTRPSCHPTNSVKALMEARSTSFRQCFDTVGSVTGRTCPIIHLCHLSPKFLFRKKWRNWRGSG